MGKIFNSVGHAFAWVIQTLIPTATKDIAAVEAVVGSNAAAQLASLAGTKGTAVQQSVLAIAGDVLHAFESAGAAIGSDGLNVAFDTVAVEAIKSLYSDLKSAIGGVAVPVKAVPIAAVK